MPTGVRVIRRPGRQGTDLAVLALQELQMQFLQLLPVPAVVKGGADHRVEGSWQVTAIKRCAYVGWRRRRRIMEDAMFMGTHASCQPRQSAGR